MDAIGWSVQVMNKALSGDGLYGCGHNLPLYSHYIKVAVIPEVRKRIKPATETQDI